MTLVLDKPDVFERGDRIYFTAPVQGFSPSDAQIEEYAFASQVKKTAPNENLIWLQGQYVEADNANLNGHYWRAGEIAMKALTPMLMPVTVMHDPSTAVGTIADVKLHIPEKDGVPRSRLDTILAIWGHRFPEVASEIATNLSQQGLMQSMECFSPWYECAECGSVFHKLPHGAERAGWCSHLLAEHGTQAARILGDVCFTGTGLIFGSRGAKGAYTEADLDLYREEVAEYHARVHTDTARTARSQRMGLVQIEDTELQTLRRERDEAKASADDYKGKAEAAERKVEETETAKKASDDAKAAAEKERDDLKADGEKAALKTTRMEALGDGFTAKLGDFTKSKLTEQASSYTEDQWEDRLKELEEMAKVKRDAKSDGTTPTPTPAAPGEEFSREDLAAFTPGAEPGGQPPASTEPGRAEQASVVGSLARAFRPAEKAENKS